MSATTTKQQLLHRVIFLIAICFLVFALPLSACENDSRETKIVSISEPFNQDHGAIEIAPISYKTAIIHEGERHRLYPTFDSNDDAFAAVSKDCKDILTLLQNSFNLDPISFNNWHEYQDALYEEFERKDCPSWFNESRNDYMEMLRLFDILENEEQNDEILYLLKEEGFESITVLLPSCYDI